MTEEEIEAYIREMPGPELLAELLRVSVELDKWPILNNPHSKDAERFKAEVLRRLKAYDDPSADGL